MIGQCTIHVIYLYVYINLCLYWSIVNHIIVCAIQNVYAYNYTLNLPQCICCSCFIDRINHQSCPVQGTWPSWPLVFFHASHISKHQLIPYLEGWRSICHARWSTLKLPSFFGPSAQLVLLFSHSSYMFPRFPTCVPTFSYVSLLFPCFWLWFPLDLTSSGPELRCFLDHL